PGAARAATASVNRAIYTGVSLYDARAFSMLPERGCLIRDGYARWIERGERVMAYFDPGSFRDVGMSLAHYLEANLTLATGRTPWWGIDGDDAGVLCAPSAQLGSGVVLQETVVGARAQIAPGVRLERCVVWPGAHVDASLREAIVLPAAGGGR